MVTWKGVAQVQYSSVQKFVQACEQGLSLSSMNSNYVQCYHYREIIQTLLFVGVVLNLKLFWQNVNDP